ncbi:hypothetical protein [Nocardioides sp. TF02-7]|uniref:hypothetical protein n=1 Tax=Nocardioides sp. TF02-7 TaxID=2917724 RepID=UPI001F066453|nr:hypothetical protein [Nocardioides sp. TF02-7]UMG91456.1 hypothetical protein MF408_15115 [Nocardioides sp. TF02-7]
MTTVEWKTRGHDRAPGLHEALVDHGFVPGEPESIMVGDAAAPGRRRTAARGGVAAPGHRGGRRPGDVRPAGRGVRRPAPRRRGRRAPCGDSPPVTRWSCGSPRPTAGSFCAGRLEPVPGTEFAGIWGGATLGSWRGRGIYRALTAARARSALALGKRLLHSDSTAMSRPILERSGLVRVSTTTPYEWRR